MTNEEKQQLKEYKKLKEKLASGGKKVWANISKEERSKKMRELAKKRWNKKTTS